MVGMGLESHRIVVKVFCGVLIYLLKLFIVRSSALGYTVRNRLDVINLAGSHLRIDICRGISQHKADILQGVVQVFVGAVKGTDVLDRLIVLDNVFVAENLHLAPGYLDFHILVENAAGFVILRFGICCGGAPSEIKVVISVGNIKSLHVQIVGEAVEGRAVCGVALNRVHENIQIDIALVFAYAIERNPEKCGFKRCLIVYFENRVVGDIGSDIFLFKIFGGLKGGDLRRVIDLGKRSKGKVCRNCRHNKRRGKRG